MTQPRLAIVAGAPRSGVALLAGQIARHPSTLLVDAGEQGLQWLEAWLNDAATPPPPEALRDAYGPHGAPTHPEWLVLAAYGLLDAEALLARLQPEHGLLIWIQRDLEASCISAARFPHLLPQMPDPHGQPDTFEAAYGELWQRQRANAAAVATRLPHQQLRYEAFVQQPEASLARLHQAMGLSDQPLKPYLRGISSTLCFRERPVDLAGLHHHWPEPAPAPLVLATGRGGSGTRLLSDLLLGLGVDLGDQLNPMGDSIQWADLVYEISLGQLHGRPASWRRGSWVDLLRQRAAVLGCGKRGPWGFKLPELMLMLEPALEAWPEAKLVHLVRHPVDVCLRRTHMTSRLNNPIGRATLAAGYQALGLQRDPADDEPWWHNAVSWWYQLGLLQKAKHSHSRRFIDLRFEEICAHPETCVRMLFDHFKVSRGRIMAHFDPARASSPSRDSNSEAAVWKLCKELAEEYQYDLPVR